MNAFELEQFNNLSLENYKLKNEIEDLKLKLKLFSVYKTVAQVVPAASNLYTRQKQLRVDPRGSEKFAVYLTQMNT